jgi:hypothetical protein
MDGLTSERAAARRALDGPNELQREPGVPAWRILVRQLTGVMPALLASAAAVIGSPRSRLR